MSLKQMQALEQGLKPEPVKVMAFNCVCGRRMVVESENGVVASPPKREWQGLTDDEIALISAECSLRTPSDIYFARAIEAKLKERNT